MKEHPNSIDQLRALVADYLQPAVSCLTVRFACWKALSAFGIVPEIPNGNVVVALLVCLWLALRLPRFGRALEQIVAEPPPHLPLRTVFRSPISFCTGEAAYFFGRDGITL